MDLGNIGSISDILSTLAVIGTLAYIAVQVRITRVGQKAEITLTAVAIFAQWRITLLQNSDLTLAMAKGNAGDPLSDAERIQLSTLFDELFYSSAGAHATGLAGGTFHDEQADTDYLIDLLERNPCGRPEWERAKANVARLSAEFVQVIDRQLT
jgi:hypothetical protein